jgi:hypothetical protein
MALPVDGKIAEYCLECNTANSQNAKVTGGDIEAEGDVG